LDQKMLTLVGSSFGHAQFRVPLARLREQLRELFCAEPCQRGVKNGFRREVTGKPAYWIRSVGRELKIVARPLRLGLRPPLSIVCPRGPTGSRRAQLRWGKAALGPGGGRGRRRCMTNGRRGFGRRGRWSSSPPWPTWWPVARRGGSRGGAVEEVSGTRSPTGMVGGDGAGGERHWRERGQAVGVGGRGECWQGELEPG
jgi:hypothetical protein